MLYPELGIVNGVEGIWSIGWPYIPLKSPITQNPVTSETRSMMDAEEKQQEIYVYLWAEEGLMSAIVPANRKRRRKDE